MKQSLQNIKVLLLDIEGTVCPISFVKDTLFPYALNALPTVLEKKWTSPDFQPYKSAFPESARESPEAFLSHVQDLTARDVKIAYLKNLQGYLWEEGYKSSAYSTPLFNDIQTIFKHPDHFSSTSTPAPAAQQSANSVDGVNSVGRLIAIYSSGSIFAQKLLFAHSQWPTTTNATTATNANANTNTDSSSNEVVDLTPQITAYYDTTTAGLKTKGASYMTIAKSLAKRSSSLSTTTSTSTSTLSPSDILFLSDNVDEIKAALEAGLKAVVVDRPGNAPLSPRDREQFDVITSFDQLAL